MNELRDKLTAALFQSRNARNVGSAVDLILPVVERELAEQREAIAAAIEAVTWLHPHDCKFVAKIARDFGREQA